jgi:hypothetical protein
MFFEKFQQFVDKDSRKDRELARVTTETLSNRMEVLLPEWMIRDKIILDYGSALGASGHWCLSKGAKAYIGVEIQKDYREESINLLSEYWTSEQFQILDSLPQEPCDITLASGVIHGHFDTFCILNKLCSLTKERLVIESINIPEQQFPRIEIRPWQMINQSNIDTPFTGVASIPTFSALILILQNNSFFIEGDKIYPKRIFGSHDAYSDLEQHTKIPNRYIARFKKSNTKMSTLEDNIANNKCKFTENKHIVFEKNQTVWEFNEEVAKKFQTEAITNIPDYERVIEMCIDVAKTKLDKTANIVDVGSALGHTVNKFIESGFNNVWGLESSQAMIDNSLVKDRIRLSSVIPNHWKTNLVIANWTLHFINERKSYLVDVYNSLEDNGILILTDKTVQTEEIKNMYYDWKRSNGISDEYIFEKEQKLQGYMHCYPVEWYIDTLRDVGFRNIQIINSRFGFVTFKVDK